MTNRYASASTATAELAADYADYRDKEVMQALVPRAHSKEWCHDIQLRLIQSSSRTAD